MNYAVKPPDNLKSFKGVLKWLNQLRDYSLSLYLNDGLTYNVDRSKYGQEIVPFGADTGNLSIFPFRVVATTNKAGNPAVTVGFGYVVSTLLPGLEFSVPLKNGSADSGSGKVIKVTEANTQVFVGWDLVKTDVTKPVATIVIAIKAFLGTLVAKGQSVSDYLSSLGLKDSDLTDSAKLLKAGFFGGDGTKKAKDVAIGIKGVKPTLTPGSFDDSAAIADLKWTGDSGKKSFTIVQNIESAIYYPFNPLPRIPWLGVGVAAGDSGGSDSTPKLNIWFGDSTASFAKGSEVITPAPIAAIHKFGLHVEDTASDASSMVLTIGDKKPKDNDGLWFAGGTGSDSASGSGKTNTIAIQWYDFPSLSMDDGGKKGSLIHLSIADKHPTLAITGSKQSATFGIGADGPHLTLTKTGGDSASEGGKGTAKLTPTKLTLKEGDFTKKLTCKQLVVGKHTFKVVEATYCEGGKTYKGYILVSGGKADSTVS